MPKPQLEWPKRPVKHEGTVLGPRQRWRSKCKRFAVDRYTEGSGHFLALRLLTNGATELLGRHPKSLDAAKRDCQDAAGSLPL